MAVKCPLPVTRREPEEPQAPVIGKHNKIAIVAPNGHIGELMEREHADKPWVKIIWPGVCFGGRLALVLVSGSTLNDILRGGPETSKRWWEECVKCRLAFNGQIIITP